MKISELKHYAEFGTGIPYHMQRLHYLDEGNYGKHVPQLIAGMIYIFLYQYQQLNYYDTPYINIIGLPDGSLFWLLLVF